MYSNILPLILLDSIISTARNPRKEGFSKRQISVKLHASRMKKKILLFDSECSEDSASRPTLMGTKNLNENGPNPFFLFGAKIMVRVKLRATVLFRYGFDY